MFFAERAWRNQGSWFLIGIVAQYKWNIQKLYNEQNCERGSRSNRCNHRSRRRRRRKERGKGISNWKQWWNASWVPGSQFWIKFRFCQPQWYHWNCGDNSPFESKRWCNYFQANRAKFRDRGCPDLRALYSEAGYCCIRSAKKLKVAQVWPWHGAKLFWFLSTHGLRSQKTQCWGIIESCSGSSPWQVAQTLK